MSAELKLKALAGGSLTLQVDDTLATDETMNISNGGIVSGSNANGNYTKFPDGTLIQYAIKEYTSVANVPFTFPIPFIDTNWSISVTMWWSTVGAKVNGFNLTGTAGTDITLSASDTGGFSWQAIGRWK